jgi:hypothetical protein
MKCKWMVYKEHSFTNSQFTYLALRYTHTTFTL